MLPAELLVEILMECIRSDPVWGWLALLAYTSANKHTYALRNHYIIRGVINLRISSCVQLAGAVRICGG